MTIVDHSGVYKDLVDYRRLCWTQLDCSTAEGSVGLEQTMLGCLNCSGVCWTLAESVGLYWTTGLGLGPCLWPLFIYSELMDDYVKTAYRVLLPEFSLSGKIMQEKL